MRRWTVAAVILALVATACGSDDPGNSTGTTLIDFGTNVAVSGEPLPPVCTGGRTPPACVEPVDGLDPMIGAIAPTAGGTSFNGDPVSITHDGSNKIILFLAHWCSHCQNEVNVFSEIYPDGTLPGGVELISVATGSDDKRPNFPPSEWLVDKGWAFPVLMDNAEDSVGTAYGLWAFPFWVVLDGSGRVLLRHAGELSPDALGSIIDTLAAG
jgi:hypothetical protein